MKKTFLLLFSLGTLASVFAQDGHGRDDYQTAYNNHAVRGDYRTASYVDYRKRDEEVAKVTVVYNRRIDAVQRDRRLRSKEKAREISRLIHEKEVAIRDINARYERQRFDHRR